MTVKLTTQTEDRLRQWVENGLYASMDEAIEAAVQLLDEHTRFERLQAVLTEAAEQTRLGNVEEWTPELHETIRQEAEERFRRGEKPSGHVCP